MCSQVSEVGRFPGQPTTWHVSLSGTTGHSVCRGKGVSLRHLSTLASVCVTE